VGKYKDEWHRRGGHSGRRRRFVPTVDLGAGTIEYESAAYPLPSLRPSFVASVDARVVSVDPRVIRVHPRGN
jgi:hypothetical protein